MPGHYDNEYEPMDNSIPGFTGTNSGISDEQSSPGFADMGSEQSVPGFVDTSEDASAYVDDTDIIPMDSGVETEEICFPVDTADDDAADIMDTGASSEMSDEDAASIMIEVGKDGDTTDIMMEVDETPDTTDAIMEVDDVRNDRMDSVRELVGEYNEQQAQERDADHYDRSMSRSMVNETGGLGPSPSYSANRRGRGGFEHRMSRR